MKKLRFIRSSLDDMPDFPSEARRQAGFELDAVQRGMEPFDWKPMTSIGTGVREIRVHVLGEWRIILCCQDSGRDLCPACFSEEDAENAPRGY